MLEPLAIVVAVCAFATQLWAFCCWRELRKLRAALTSPRTSGRPESERVTEILAAAGLLHQGLRSAHAPTTN